MIAELKVDCWVCYPLMLKAAFCSLRVIIYGLLTTVIIYVFRINGRAFEANETSVFQNML